MTKLPDKHSHYILYCSFFQYANANFHIYSIEIDIFYLCQARLFTLEHEKSSELEITWINQTRKNRIAQSL